MEDRGRIGIVLRELLEESYQPTTNWRVQSTYWLFLLKLASLRATRPFRITLLWLSTYRGSFQHVDSSYTQLRMEKTRNRRVWRNQGLTIILFLSTIELLLLLASGYFIEVAQTISCVTCEHISPRELYIRQYISTILWERRVVGQ